MRPRSVDLGEGSGEAPIERTGELLDLAGDDRYVAQPRLSDRQLHEGDAALAESANQKVRSWTRDRERDPGRPAPEPRSTTRPGQDPGAAPAE